MTTCAYCPASAHSLAIFDNGARVPACTRHWRQQHVSQSSSGTDHRNIIGYTWEMLDPPFTAHTLF